MVFVRQCQYSCFWPDDFFPLSGVEKSDKTVLVGCRGGLPTRLQCSLLSRHHKDVTVKKTRKISAVEMKLIRSRKLGIMGYVGMIPYIYLNGEVLLKIACSSWHRSFETVLWRTGIPAKGLEGCGC